VWAVSTGGGRLFRDDAAESVMYFQNERVKLSVLSTAGKEVS
jgi:hypothetical protein